MLVLRNLAVGCFSQRHILEKQDQALRKKQSPQSLVQNKVLSEHKNGFLSLDLKKQVKEIISQ